MPSKKDKPRYPYDRQVGYYFREAFLGAIKAIGVGKYREQEQIATELNSDFQSNLAEDYVMENKSHVIE